MSKVDETGDINSTLSNLIKKNRFNNFNKLSNLRIIQKQLVYVIGLSFNYAFKEVSYFLLFSLYQILNILANTEE